MKRMDIPPKPRFNFTKLLIALMIIVILAGLSLPSYRNYLRRNAYSEIAQATEPFKAGVSECYQRTKNLNECNGGKNYIPVDITTTTGPVATLTTQNGVITVTPVSTLGIKASDTYVLTPQIANNTLTWTTSGGSVTAGYIQ